MNSTGKYDLLRNHLRSGRSITGIQALKLYGIYRLSSAINRFRNSGMNIRTVMQKDLFGNEFAEYILLPENK